MKDTIRLEKNTSIKFSISNFFMEKSGVKESAKEEIDIFTEVSSKAKWSEECYKLSDFAKMQLVPQPILICKGKFEKWLPNSESSTDLVVMAIDRRYQFKLRAKYAHISPEEKRVMGSEFEITDEFEGWFEILSEDGNELFRIKSVSELVNHREKTFVAMKKVHAHRLLDSGQWERCDLEVGDVITEIDVRSVLPDSTIPSCGCGRLLVCMRLGFDAVYLPMDEAGEFSILGEDYFTGPRSVSQLASMKFPMYVKLMEGSPPPNDSEYFSRTMKIVGVDFEEVLTVWPMQQGDRFVHIPVKSDIGVKIVDNLKEMQGLPINSECNRRIESLLQKGKIRARYQPQTFRRIRSSLLRPFLQTLLQPSNEKALCHQPNTSKSYINPKQTVTTATNILSSNTLGQPTSGSVDLGTSSSLKATSTASLYQPHDSGSIFDLPKETSDPLTNIQLSSNSGLSRTGTANVFQQASGTPEETTDIHPPSSSRPRSSSRSNTWSTIKEFSQLRVSRSLKSKSDGSYPEPREEVDCQESSDLHPINVRRSSKIETSKQREDQQTTDLFDEILGEKDKGSESENPTGGPRVGRGKCSPRIKTKRKKDESYLSASAVAQLFLSEEMDEVDPQPAGQAAVYPSTDHLINLDTDEVCPVMDESLSEKGDQKECMDPYDEIDLIYAENRRISRERSRIPVEKETFL